MAGISINPFNFFQGKTRQAKLNTIEETFDNAIENPDYTRKLYLIENCIYGVDIQPIAMMISKLRFFISLVCEQDKININDPQHNFGVNTLPNLETKFVAANTLLDADIRKYTNDWTQDDHLLKLKDELLAIRHRHFYAQKRSQKRRILEEDKAKRKEISDYIITSTAKPDDAIIKRDQDMIKADFLEIEKYREPKMGTTTRYTSLFDEPEVIMVDVNAQKRKDLLDHIKTCEAEIRREENKKNPVGFEAAVKQVTDWNPYDQNASSPFLDIEWMFGMKDKFDIVIGNPPYIQLQNNDGELAALYENVGFSSYDRSGDIYCLFYERGCQLLIENGVLCYITSNKWMRNNYGENLRSFFVDNTNSQLLYNFAGIQLFENATVETNILLLTNTFNRYKTNSVTTAGQNIKVLSHLREYFEDNKVESSFDTSDSWIILSSKDNTIKDKVNKLALPLSSWDIQINFGIKTGYNKAYLIDSSIRQMILENCQDQEEKEKTSILIKPILRGRDIKRYKYQWADQWLINIHNGVGRGLKAIDINEYPALKTYLDTYWDKICSRSDKGHTPYNLRNCAYLFEFEKPKIIWGEISDHTKFCFDEKGKYYCEASTFFMTGDISVFLLCYLNSKLSEYLFSKIATTTGMGTVRWKKYKIEKLLVPRLPQNDIDKITKLYRQYQNSDNLDCLSAIDDIIYKYFDFTKDEISKIEKLYD